MEQIIESQASAEPKDSQEGRERENLPPRTQRTQRTQRKKEKRISSLHDQGHNPVGGVGGAFAAYLRDGALRWVLRFAASGGGRSGIHADSCRFMVVTPHHYLQAEQARKFRMRNEERRTEKATESVAVQTLRALCHNRCKLSLRVCQR